MAGMAGVFVYALLCAVRKHIGRGRVLSFVEDVIYAVVFAFISYMFMLKTCGAVRGLNYIFEFLGAAATAYIVSYYNYKKDVKRQKLHTAKEAFDGIKKSSKEKKT